MVSAVEVDSTLAMVPGCLYTDHRAPTVEHYQANLKREAARSQAGILADGVSRVPTLKAGNTVTITGEDDTDNKWNLWRDPCGT